MTKEELLIEAQRRYPVGTKFYPAQCKENEKSVYSIVTNTDFKFANNCKWIVSETDENDSINRSDSLKYGTNKNWCRFVYCEGIWAEILKYDNIYKGQISNFPSEIVEKMLYYQEKQGNKRDVSVFEKNKASAVKGFEWDETDEGKDFWTDVINNNDFDCFFEKYPKSNVVCGVTLERGKDYHITEKDNTWIIRFEKFVDDILYDSKAISKTTYYGFQSLKGWGEVSSIKSIRPATVQESKHLNQCIAANKYVEMEKTYEYEVVHCTTQEQWDFVKEKLGYTFLNQWKVSEQDSCIDIIYSGSGAINWFKERNSKVYSFQDWCVKFNHQFEDFKVGDWVVITKSDEDWVEKMDKFVGKCVQITLMTKDGGICFLNDENWNWKYKEGHFRKALLHEIPQLEFKTFVAGQDVSVDVRYIKIEILRNPCQEIFLNSFQEVMYVAKQEYKVEDGYLPYPEPIIDLSLILSTIN
jgi:hypothetical protein